MSQKEKKMIDDWFKTKLETDENGNITLRGNYDIAGELVHEITERKETLWKRFCKDVCEKMVAYYSEGPIDVIHFHKVFNEKFGETVKEWTDEKGEE